MATQSMVAELVRRGQWLAAFREAVRRQSSDPHHHPIWPNAKDYYLEGYTAEQAATKYLEALHLGENS